jgi:ABC-type lipoprotein release transport system permease subunit
MGVPGTADVPVLAILAIIAAALVLACCLAVLPARAAASLKPAKLLRAE